MYETIGYRVEDGVAEILVNQPKYRNALSVQTMQDMLDALNRAEDDDSVGAVLLTGVGDAFCSGFNLKEIPLDRGVDGVRGHSASPRCGGTSCCTRWSGSNGRCSPP